MELLNPKNDYTFKRIFGYVGNENITKELISTILDEKIESITLDCKEILEQDLQSDKLGILDIRAITDNHTQIDIEMQMVDQKNIEDRVLFYWCNMFAKSIEAGKDYKNSKRTIVILFVDYEIAGLEKIEKYISKWKIREEDYCNYVLTDKFEIVIIEIPKYRKLGGENRKLNTWLKFIDNPGGVCMEDVNENETLKEAKDVLEQISNDEYERDLEFKRKLYLMDRKVNEEARYEEGLEEGREEGRKESRKEIAKEMLKKDINIETIMECTGLTKEKILELQNEKL